MAKDKGGRYAGKGQYKKKRSHGSCADAKKRQEYEVCRGAVWGTGRRVKRRRR